MRSFLIPILFASAFWPVWLWYLTRTTDRSDEPWGLLSLATAVVMMAIHGKSVARDHHGLLIEPKKVELISGIACLFTYVTTFTMAPNLVRAILFVLTMHFLFVSRLPTPSKSGVAGLLLLSLPLLPSLNFYAGYPLRAIVAQGACIMLAFLNMHTSVDGVMVAVNGHVSAIDAPCSGINMLWTELYLCMLIACCLKLDFKQTFALGLGGFVLTLLANVLRATTLLIFDQYVLAANRGLFAKEEPTFHLLTGLMVFFGTCIVSILLASFLKQHLKQQENLPDLNTPPKTGRLAFGSYLNIPVFGMAIAAALIPFVVFPGDSTNTADISPIWPKMINGQKLVPFNSLAEEKDFAADFPGAMQKFTDGRNSYFVRYLRKETRQLHSSADCLKGMGYQIEPQPISVERDGTQWGTSIATKNGAQYLIKERIYDAQGISSTDVSQWYWLATLQKTHGPWYAITIAEPVAHR